MSQNPNRDKDMEDVRKLVKAAEEAVDAVREKVWSMIRKDPAYSLVVLGGLKSAARDFHSASLFLDRGSDLLADVHTIESAGAA